MSARRRSLFLVAALVTAGRPAFAQEAPPSPTHPMSLASLDLPPAKPAGENPYDLLRRGTRNRKTGIVLTIIGALHLAATVGTSAALAACHDRCELAGSALLGSSISTGLIAVHLLGAGIPTWVGGQRQIERARRLIDELPRDVEGRAIPSPEWNEDAEAVRSRAEKLRWKGISLLAVGGFNLALTGALGASLAYCWGAPRGVCGDLLPLSLLPGIAAAGLGGIITLGLGGSYYTDARRTERLLDRRGGDSGVQLTLSIGRTIGVTGTF